MRKKRIAIIDYDAGNLGSVQKAFLHLGEEAIITREKEEIWKADGVVLPGVGAFWDAMGKLRHYHLDEVIEESVRGGQPFLGICLGLQLLFERSEEGRPGKEEGHGAGDNPGLALLEGEVVRIPDKDGLKIPHIGWNSLKVAEGATLLKGLPQEPYVYFVHSYYLKAKNESDVAALTEYGVPIHASVERGNLFACQFHPEKSGDVGMVILKNFANLL